MEVSGKFHAPPTSPQGKSPWYPPHRRLGGPQNRSEHGGVQKNTQSLPGLEPHPAHSPALYHWAILACLSFVWHTTPQALSEEQSTHPPPPRGKTKMCLRIHILTEVRGCIQKCPNLPPRAGTANFTALCHLVQLCRYSVNQSSEFCCHKPLCCFSTSVCCYLFRYWLSPETFGYTLVSLLH